MTRRRPGLVCLNLQRDFLEPGSQNVPRAAHVLANAHACLGWARRFCLPVFHVFSTDRGAPLVAPRPIQGFHAHPTEMIAFKHSTSMFDCDQVTRAIGAVGNAFVIGFTGSEDCLAAAFDARRRDVRLIFVTDAISSRALPVYGPDTVDGVMGEVLGALAGNITTFELLSREASAFIQGAPEPFRRIGGTP